MTRSSGIDSVMGGVLTEKTSHPFQASFQPCFHRARLPATGRDCRSCCCSWSLEKVRRKKKKRQAYRRGSGLQVGDGHGGSGGPLPWPPGEASVATLIALRSSVPCSLLFLGVFPFRVSSVLLGSLTAGASLCCPCLARMDVDREMRRLVCFLYFPSFLYSVKGFHALGHAILASLGQLPLFASHFPFAGFRSWRSASSVHSLLLK